MTYLCSYIIILLLVIEFSVLFTQHENSNPDVILEEPVLLWYGSSSLASYVLRQVNNGRGLLFAQLTTARIFTLSRPRSSNPEMALYVGVACSRRRDLFKLCPHRHFILTSG